MHASYPLGLRMSVFDWFNTLPYAAASRLARIARGRPFRSLADPTVARAAAGLCAAVAQMSRSTSLRWIVDGLDGSTLLLQIIPSVFVADSVEGHWPIPHEGILLLDQGLGCLLSIATGAGLEAPQEWQAMFESQRAYERTGPLTSWWQVYAYFTGTGPTKGFDETTAALCAEAVRVYLRTSAEGLPTTAICRPMPWLERSRIGITINHVRLFAKICQTGSASQGIRWLPLRDAGMFGPTLVTAV